MPHDQGPNVPFSGFNARENFLPGMPEYFNAYQTRFHRGNAFLQGRAGLWGVNRPGYFSGFAPRFNQWMPAAYARFNYPGPYAFQRRGSGAMGYGSFQRGYGHPQRFPFAPRFAEAPRTERPRFFARRARPRFVPTYEPRPGAPEVTPPVQQPSTPDVTSPRAQPVPAPQSRVEPPAARPEDQEKKRQQDQAEREEKAFRETLGRVTLPAGIRFSIVSGRTVRIADTDYDGMFHREHDYRDVALNALEKRFAMDIVAFQKWFEDSLKKHVEQLLRAPVSPGFTLERSAAADGVVVIVLRRDGTSWSVELRNLVEERFRKNLSESAAVMSKAMPEAEKRFSGILQGVSRPAGMDLAVNGSTITLRCRGRTTTLDYSMHWRNPSGWTLIQWDSVFREKEIVDALAKDVEAFRKTVEAEEKKLTKEQVETLRNLRSALDEKTERIRKLCAGAIVPAAERKVRMEQIRDLIYRSPVTDAPAQMGINQCLQRMRGIDPGFILRFDDEVLGIDMRVLLSYDRPDNRIVALEFDYRRFYADRPADDPRNVSMRECIGSIAQSPRSISSSFFMNMPREIKIFRNMVNTDAVRSQEDCHLRQDETRENAFYFDIPCTGGRERWYISNLALTIRRRVADADGAATNEFTISRIRADGSIDYSTAMPLQRAGVFDIVFTERVEGERRFMELTNFALRPNWSQVVRKAIESSRKERESEEQDEAGMRGFDLPGDQDIAYLAFHQQNVGDGAMRGQATHFTRMASILNARGYRIALPEGRRFDDSGRVVNSAGTAASVHVLVDRDPRVVIREQLQAVAKRGIRHVYMELACHGAADGGLYFVQNDGSRQVLNYAQLMGIFQEPEFRTMHFTVSTVACYGGWGTEQAEKFRKTLLDVAGSAEGRVTIITQSKPYIYNVGGFEDALRYYLGAGMTFGQAVRAADRHHRWRTYGTSNPEIRRSSPTRPTQTARGDELVVPEDRA